MLSNAISHPHIRPFVHPYVHPGFRAAFRLALATALAFSVLAPMAVRADDDDWGTMPPDARVSATPASSAQAGSPSTSPLQSAPLPSKVAHKVQALKEQANKFYRARKYANACAIYREASLLDSSDAGLRNDLGICFQNLGRKDSALQFTRDALRLADRSLAEPTEEEWSFPDMRSRKTSYFNLDRLGGPMTPPRPGQCETWSAMSTCKGRFHVCVEDGSRPAEGGTLRWNVLRVGLTRARALFSYDEVEVPSHVPRPEMRDMEEMSIEGIPESKSRWINRDSSVVIPLGELLETKDSACVKNCGNLERDQSECRIIHFDPCAGVVGVACGIQEADGKDRIVIGEFYLIPAKELSPVK